MEETTFSTRVYSLATLIPAGRVTTYGALAKAAGGGAMAARSITSILSKAPNQRAIPYHRIVYAGGRVWLPETKPEARIRLYKKEGIVVSKTGQISDFEEHFYDFSDL